MAQKKFKIKNLKLKIIKNFPKIIIFLILLIIIFSKNVNAESPYVLPYPSQMPGSKFYTINQVIEKLSYFWYFGSFGKFEYYLKLSDKYLVESKTLFEYKQYLLAHISLQDSNKYFKRIYPSLINAQKEEKNISEKIKLFKEASAKHIEILEKLKRETPSDFTWIPEKEDKTYLKIHKLLNDSIKLRELHL